MKLIQGGKKGWPNSKGPVQILMHDETWRGILIDAQGPTLTFASLVRAFKELQGSKHLEVVREK